jgi:hypothetical protein
LRDADKIVVIEDGVVIENGSHEQLLGRNGVYAQLHRLQFDQRTWDCQINGGSDLGIWVSCRSG